MEQTVLPCLKLTVAGADIVNAMDHAGDASFDTDAVLRHLSPWEVALTTVSQLAVVFALSISLILILGHQLAGPL